MGYNILFPALLFCIAIAYSQPALHCEQSAVPPSPNEWSGWGRDIENSRYNPLTAIDADTVSSLTLRCNYSSAAGITSQPSYSDGVLYFGDNQVTHSGASAGYVYAVRGSDCSLIWRSKLSSYTGVSTSNTRWTPLVYQGKVIVGDRTAGSGWVVALNIADGSLAWRTRVETHPWTILTGSASAGCGTIFFGVSSMEETASKFPGFSGFSFRGSVVALNADDGSLLWKHYTMPNIAGYAGAAVWASSPSIDLTSRRVFVGTGNGYALPPSVQNCSETALRNNQSVEPCFGSDAADVQYDSILALNIDDGSVAWIAKKRDYDVWSVACIALPAGNPWCPKIRGPDFDFGQNPILYQANNPGGKYLAIGQKSGLMFSVSADDGSSRWDTAAGVGGVIGGLLFGSTSDADNIFGQQGNSVYSYWTDSNTNTTYCGSYIVAYDKNTGSVKWQTPSVRQPSPAQCAQAQILGWRAFTLNTFGGFTGPNYYGEGAITASGNVQKSVVFGTTMFGDIYALRGATGELLWRFTTSNGEGAGNSPTVVGSSLFWATGYLSSSIGAAPGNTVYAFSL